MDFSDAVERAARNYGHLPNIFFIRDDITKTKFPDSCIDYLNCDQTIMHTQNPDRAFAELVRITKKNKGQLACYFYAKKALPRELIDEHFRSQCVKMSRTQLWEMSEQLAELGRRLSGLKVSFNAPNIPALGIKGGRYDLQRFLYWNFLKCFWNKELGRQTSVVTNYDWYSPSLARRYSRKEVLDLIKKNGLRVSHFYQEDACYSGRFVR
jgi:SAM-dependent methyltransferase